jgi:four helix bundle protein
MKFAFEDLEVYKRSIQFVSEIETLLEQTKVNRALSDQLSRAALSIPLNIAEGNGRWHKGDKRQFFWIARGSVFECVPIIEILRIKEVISDEKKLQLREQLEVIGKMITRLIQVHTE